VPAGLARAGAARAAARKVKAPPDRFLNRELESVRESVAINEAGVRQDVAGDARVCGVELDRHEPRVIWHRAAHAQRAVPAVCPELQQLRGASAPDRRVEDRALLVADREDPELHEGRLSIG